MHINPYSEGEDVCVRCYPCTCTLTQRESVTPLMIAGEWTRRSRKRKPPASAALLHRVLPFAIYRAHGPTCNDRHRLSNLPMAKASKWKPYFQVNPFLSKLYTNHINQNFINIKSYILVLSTFEFNWINNIDAGSNKT